LTRSRSSEDSISTWYESLPPTTPHLERDATLPAENNGEDCERDNEAVDKEMKGVGEFGHRDHAQFHYSDITITIKNDSDDGESRLSRLSPHSQSQPTLTLPPSAPQQTANTSFQIPTFPKDVKKERGALRKKLVRIKLQPVDDIDDLENIPSPFSALNLKTMTRMSVMTPITRPAEVGRVEVGLPEVPVAALSIPTVMVTNSEDTLLTASSISLPTPIVKKKRSSFRSVLRSFIARW
jgi:hypothetical protein